jgi:hypothetical protein
MIVAFTPEVPSPKRFHGRVTKVGPGVQPHFGDGQPGCSCRLLACLANYETINCAEDTRSNQMKTRILTSLIAALFAIAFSGLPISYAAEFEWGDTTALKEHLDSHVKFPATGKVIKESCKVEMPDEFAKEQRTYLDSKLKDDTTYKNAGEVLAALNLK